MGDSIEYCEQCGNRVGCHLARQCYHAKEQAPGPLDAASCSARDTPRTDWREARSEGLHDEWCFSLCRQLERELNVANDKVARLQALYDCMDPKGFIARKIEAILGQNVSAMPTASEQHPNI